MKNGEKNIISVVVLEAAIGTHRTRAEENL